MVTFCAELETGAYHSKLPVYKSLVIKIAEWYQHAFETFSPRLLLESGLHTMYEDIEQLNEKLAFTEDLNYNFSAKLSYFNISDTLVKLILSKYSYGASPQFLSKYGIDFPNNAVSKTNANCWLYCTANELVLTEILARVLSEEKAEYTFDLVSLMVDRTDRNRITHASQTAACLSAIRCYNSIRAMLVFIDPEYEQQLHVFEPKTYFNYDEFLAPPCKLDFDNYSTILIADSVHDLRKDYQEAVANLPWNIVVDLDGHSDCGGLLSSINHNQVSKGILTVANHDTIAKGITYWYRCGTYQFPHYQPYKSIPDDKNRNNEMSIPSAVPFHDGRIQRSLNKYANIHTIAAGVLQKINQFDRPINILMVTNNSNVVSDVVRFLQQNSNDYVLTWVGLSSKTTDEILREWYRQSEEDMADHFQYFNCPIEQFYIAFAQHKGGWKYRTTLKRNFTLPGANGPVEISENERINLFPFFDVLYDGVDIQDRDVVKIEREGFDKGNTASWSVISSEYAVSLKKGPDIDRIKGQIKSVLGAVIREKLQNKLFFIKHKAGMGGTTLCRQLAWSLHKEYAVLYIKKYKQGAINELVSKLYDNTLGKAPVILVADDTNAALRNICDEVMHLERRCILLAACRHDNPILAEYVYVKTEPLMRLSDEAVDHLRDHFRHVSKLDSSLLNQRDKDFRNELQGDMQTPFIIGLYYLEKDYNIVQYVEKALDGCGGKTYQDVLARLALCDRYNYKDVPKSLVNKGANLIPRENFLRVVPAAESVLCLESYEDIDCYRFKHRLLSDEVFQQYANRYYSGSIEQATFEIANKLIDDVASLPDPKEEHFNLLVGILIQNKVSMSEEGLNLSALLSTIGTNSCKLILDKLSSTFSPRADLIISKDVSSRTSIEKTILRTVSHAYAHLGRVYSRVERNASKAEENMKLAIHYMPDEDPNIFHMAGISIFDNLKKQCDDLLGLEDYCNVHVDFEKFEKIVTDASDCFDKASDYGSPDYGIPSKLRLLYRYLYFVYKVKCIKNETEVKDKLSLNQQRLLQEFLITLDFANSYSGLSVTAADKIREYEELFYSNVLFGEYGNVINYYETALYNARQNHDVAQETLALKGVVISRIRAAKAKCPIGSSIYRSMKNSEQLNLKNYFEELLKRPLTESSFRARMQQNNYFHHWVQLAKLTPTSLENALNLIQQWCDFEEENPYRKNPEPYYYLQVVHYLSALDGNQRSIDEAKKAAQKIRSYEETNRLDKIRFNLYHIKDVLIKGTGLGRLFDVSFCANDEQAILSALAEEPKKPQETIGILKGIRDHALAELSLANPMEWSGMPVYIRIGKGAANSLSENQINHRIQFFMGFSFIRPTALADTAKDIETERFDGFSVIDNLHDQFVESKEKHTSPPQALPKRQKTDIIARSIKSIPQKVPLEFQKPQQKFESKSPSQREALENYPNLNRKEVNVILSEENHLSGKFVYEGKEYSVRLTPVPTKTAKLLKQRGKEKKSVKCQICGKPEKGKYTAKLKENL